MDLQEGGTHPEPLCLYTSLQVRSMTWDNEVCSKEGNCKKKKYWGTEGKKNLILTGKCNPKSIVDCIAKFAPLGSRVPAGRLVEEAISFNQSKSQMYGYYIPLRAVGLTKHLPSLTNKT